MEMTDVFIWISSFWMYSTVGVPAIIEFVYEKIKKPSTKLWKSIWSWVIPITATYIVWLVGLFYGIGFLSVYEAWWIPMLLGGFSAAISNYSWENIPWLKEAITNIIKLLPTKK